MKHMINIHIVGVDCQWLCSACVTVCSTI